MELSWTTFYKLVWWPQLAPHDIFGGFLLTLLLTIYVGIIAYGCKLLADGCELLSATRQTKVVSNLIVPILSALPECFMVMYSGWGGSNIETQIGTGLGALCGSTAMVLTIPWAFCINNARVEIKDGHAQYPKNPLAATVRAPDQWGWLDTGVEVQGEVVAQSAKVMMATCVLYLGILFPALRYCAADDEVKRTEENDWMGGIALCAYAAFLGVIYYFWQPIPTLHEEIAAAQLRGEAQADLLSKGYTIEQLAPALTIDCYRHDEDSAEYTRLVEGSQRPMNNDLDMCLLPTFRRFARDDDAAFKVIDRHQLQLAFHALGVHKSNQELLEILHVDADKVNWTFPEFCTLVEKYLLNPPDHSHMGGLSSDVSKSLWRVAAWPLVLGVLLIALLTKPMIILFEEISTRTDVSTFVYGYLVCPFVSNATLLTSSGIFSEKRTLAMITSANLQCYQTASVNNTLVLGIFAMLIYMDNLYIEYAPTFAMLILLEMLMFAVALHKTLYTRFDGLTLLLIFPGTFLFTVLVRHMSSYLW